MAATPAAPGPRAQAGAKDWSLSIGRQSGAVVVKVGGPVDATAAVTLKHVLTDLVDNQGNVLVALEIPRSALHDAEVLAVLTEMAPSDDCHARQLQVDNVASIALDEARQNPGPVIS